MSDVQSPQENDDLPPKRTNELTMRVVSSIVLGLVAITAAWLGGLVFLALWTVAAAAVWWEWVGIVKAESRPVLIGVGAAAIVGMAVALAAGAAVYFVAAKLLRIPEVDQLLRVVRGR